MKGPGGEPLIPNEAASAVREAQNESYAPTAVSETADNSSSQSLPLPDGPGAAPPEVRRLQWWAAVRNFFTKREHTAPRA
jgi:hypothetical protein